MAQLKDYLDTDFGYVHLAVKKSHLYHLEREKYHHCWAQIFMFLIIILSAFWGLVLSKWPDLALVGQLIGPAGILFVSTLMMICDSSKKSAIHRLLASQFNRLDTRMIACAQKNDAAADSFQIERQGIEQDELPDLEVLNIVMHNKVHQSIGDDGSKEDSNLVYIGWFRRSFAQFGVSAPKRWKYLNEHEKDKKKRKDLRCKSQQNYSTSGA